MTRNSEDRTSETAGVARGERTAGRLRVSLLAACALIGGVIGGTGSYAVAAGRWHHGFRLERLQARVVRALDGVGANTAQEAKIHDIIASTFGDMSSDREARKAAGKQMLDLLRAPTIDRAAVERLRADQIATMDARSKTIATAILDAADQLTPQQRDKLADNMQSMMQRHGERHRDEGPDGGQHGPDGPDGGPDKG